MDTQLQKKYKVLLLGDNCADEYLWGSVNRISPEAPVPVINYSHSESKPGMVGNVNKNLLNLGIDVTLIAGLSSTKTRVIDTKSKQQLLRIDRDIVSEPLMPADLNKITLSTYDALVIVDYNKGFISYEMIEFLRRKFTGPMFLDTKKQDLSRFHGIHVKINELEYKSRWSINDSLIVTLGDKGALYKRFNDEQIFSVPKIEVIDVCGAGDTFLSAMTYMFLHTRSIPEAIEFANRASTITVRHMGNYAPTLEELA